MHSYCIPPIVTVMFYSNHLSARVPAVVSALTVLRAGSWHALEFGVDHSTQACGCFLILQPPQATVSTGMYFAPPGCVWRVVL